MQIDSTLAGAGFFLTDKRMNKAKFMLSFISGFFDVFILVQMKMYHRDQKQLKSDIEQGEVKNSECEMSFKT